MDVNKLAYMANQIARNFAMQGEGAAIDATATHIIKFWDPRMKANMLAGNRTLLSPIAAAAMDKVEADVKAKAAA